MRKSGKRKIVETATKSGYSLSEYNRKMILNGKVHSKFTQEELAQLRTISGISNNLNQLTTLFNYFKKNELSDNMDKRLGELDVILEELRKIQFR